MDIKMTAGPVACLEFWLLARTLKKSWMCPLLIVQRTAWWCSCFERTRCHVSREETSHSTALSLSVPLSGQVQVPLCPDLCLRFWLAHMYTDLNWMRAQQTQYRPIHTHKSTHLIVQTLCHRFFYSVRANWLIMKNENLSYWPWGQHGLRLLLYKMERCLLSGL